jgi:hypothetical protein
MMKSILTKDALWYGMLFTTAFALSACASSRFQSSTVPEPVSQLAKGPAFNAPGAPLDPVPASPSGAVTAQALPPLPGMSPTTTGGVSERSTVDLGAPGPGPVVADVPSSIPTLAPASPNAIASLAAPATAPSSIATTRNSVIGSWTAKDAAGTTCRVTLSSSPALDLYRASASSCGNKDLARVTAWDFRDGDVYLYQPGGSVAARLKGDSKTMDGALAKSGAPVNLVR